MTRVRLTLQYVPLLGSDEPTLNAELLSRASYSRNLIRHVHVGQERGTGSKRVDCMYGRQSQVIFTQYIIFLMRVGVTWQERANNTPVFKSLLHPSHPIPQHPNPLNTTQPTTNSHPSSYPPMMKQTTASTAFSAAKHHCFLYGLIFITSFLATLMMLWHISTAHLIDNYDMPPEWSRTFIKAQFPVWRIAMWVALFSIVPLNIIHALLALDFYAGLVHPWGQDKAMNKTSRDDDAESTTSNPHGANTPPNTKRDPSTATLTTGRSPRQTPSSFRLTSTLHRQSPSSLTTPSLFPQPHSAAQLPTILTPPKTCHPFFRPTLSSYLHRLLTLYDTLLIALLLSHMVITFRTLHRNTHLCSYDHIGHYDPLWGISSNYFPPPTEKVVGDQKIVIKNWRMERPKLDLETR
ncbi:hypothetical protein K504DRAFT_489640 [Pleomassaria siparia CBS 279.74]|uniref:Uncharacterized protein n=1 Tax=Pleomassaria siparia CBS 279.74 TaxID=1314801 RepID=A0A6G1KHG9_9PLEO|nr:hypothetical protein K504DRAFT_489640 [Pleomassaria siparia CBS 279.74]